MFPDTKAGENSKSGLKREYVTADDKLNMVILT